MYHVIIFLNEFLCVLNDNILLLNHIHVECEAGTYGVNCEESCGDFCEGNMCDHKDGACSCTKWGIGAMCDRIIGKIEIIYILIDSVILFSYCNLHVTALSRLHLKCFLKYFQMTLCCRSCDVE